MMTIKHILLVAVASLGAVGCVGDLQGTDPDPGTGSDPGTGGDTAKTQYEAAVAPVLTAKCAGCHTAGHPSGNTTGFVDSNAATAYATITGYVAVVGSFDAATAPVLTKIAAGHNNVTYTSAELGKITTWLNAEIQERNPGVGTGGGTGSGSGSGTGQTETASQANKRLLKQWSGCMTKTDFDTANMAGNVGGWQTNNNQECDNCHATGSEGMIASRDVAGGGQTFFNVISQHSAYMQQYFIVDMTGGTATAAVKMNRASFDGVSTRKAPHVEHPTFDSTDNGRGIQAISQFYTLTMAHVATPATCEVPAGRLID
jgi:hypothetical protein